MAHSDITIGCEKKKIFCSDLQILKTLKYGKLADFRTWGNFITLRIYCNHSVTDIQLFLGSRRCSTLCRWERELYEHGERGPGDQ